MSGTTGGLQVVDGLQALDQQAAQSFGDAAVGDAELPCQKKKTWIAVRVIDENGKVMPDIVVRMTPAAGAGQDVQTPAKGKSHEIRNIDPGQWKIELPGVFDQEWRFQ